MRFLKKWGDGLILSRGLYSSLPRVSETFQTSPKYLAVVPQPGTTHGSLEGSVN